MLRRGLFIMLPLAVIGGLTAVLAGTLTKPVLQGDGYLDRPLPEFARPALAGTPDGLSDADFVGAPALVNVFSSWCSACKAEHPMLMALKERSPLPLYGINWKDRPGAATAFLNRHGNPYERTGEDAQGELGRALGVTGVPETYLVDASGRIRYRHIGPIDEATWSGVLEPLIAQLEQGQ